MSDQKTIVITGASQGIGREIARVFAHSTSHHLILMARNADNLDETIRLCTSESANPGIARHIISIPVDLTDPEAVQSICLPGELPTPSILILNAGHFLYKSLANTSHEDFSAQISQNLFSSVHVVSRFLPAMKERGAGSVFGIDSVGALKGLPESGAYSASKHALLGYLRSLRKELLKTGIGVTAIHLGQTYSPSWDGSQINPDWLIDPADVGHLILSLTRLSVRSIVEEITLMPRKGEVPPM